MRIAFHCLETLQSFPLKQIMLVYFKICPHFPSLPWFQKLGTSLNIAYIMLWETWWAFFSKDGCNDIPHPNGSFAMQPCRSPTKRWSLICLCLNLGWTLLGWPTVYSRSDAVYFQSWVIKGNAASALFIGTFALVDQSQHVRRPTTLRPPCYKKAKAQEEEEQVALGRYSCR